ncbi:cytochrome P450 7B1-like [Hoplias malabaricus]|uniref:cytochrome P450 7B1-like n=1 Tax=Hoplias malabaricus TaxID=27720 RepID=UPI0034635EA4
METFLTLVLGVVSVLLLHALLSRRRREGEPPLIKGWIPFLGKTLEFRKDSHQFLQQLQQRHGDVFTVLIAGKYMTFVMNPLLYPAVIKHGKQLDFHEFTDSAASRTFGYPAMSSERFPGLSDKIQKLYPYLQGPALNSLTLSMMGNLQLLLRLRTSQMESPESDWIEEDLYEFCEHLMFEASFLTLYGKPPQARSPNAHSQWTTSINTFREKFRKFDAMFPLLIAHVPICLLGKTGSIREELISFFHPRRMSEWTNGSEFVQMRSELFQQYDTLRDRDKAAHHFAILWASVGNTIPACFWVLYHLLSDPVALRAVWKEIVEVIGEKEVENIHTHDVKLTKEKLDRMIYLESAINESLRLSSASMNIRVVQEDFCLHLDSQCSVCVRKGDIVVLHPQSTHLDPDIYTHPKEYQFDRFVEGGKEKTEFYKGNQKVRYYRMPFGSGATMCPGRFFAINEMKQFVCITLLIYEMQLIDGQPKAMLDTNRAGLGILPPTNHVSLRYRPK